MPDDRTVAIRRATPADESALGRLGEILIAVHHGFDAGRFIASGPDARRGYGEFLAGELARSDALVLVAETGEGDIAGYIYAVNESDDWMSLRGPAGVIYDLAVDPEQRRAGVGRLLVESALEALQGLGAKQIVLFSATQNQAAQRLFASCGFRSTMVEMTRDDPA